MESRILAALSRPDDFLLNPLFQCQSGTTPETSLNAYGTNQETNEEASQSNAYSEAGISQSQMTRNFGQEKTHDMVTRVDEEVT